jgi:hypothetical protein
LGNEVLAKVLPNLKIGGKIISVRFAPKLLLSHNRNPRLATPSPNVPNFVLLYEAAGKIEKAHFRVTFEAAAQKCTSERLPEKVRYDITRTRAFVNILFAPQYVSLRGVGPNGYIRWWQGEGDDFTAGELIVRPNGRKLVQPGHMLSFPPLDEIQTLRNPLECEAIRVERLTAMLNNVLWQKRLSRKSSTLIFRQRTRSARFGQRTKELI